MTVKVKPGQDLFDVAAQTTGVAENALQIAEANNLMVTSSLVPGSSLIIPDTLVNNAKIQGQFERRNIFPATAESLDGIDYMAVSIDNIIT
ncbi:MAG: LysM peptidoglycan-binding domain-containing protein [Lentimicrobium sp.]|jgi:hypothetical protein|nr:LysM peptidoglycan-binding domain-containing protein [Lentimicrobium sp.]